MEGDHNKVASEGNIVLAMASSGIAALLLEGGRTAHSRFHIPLVLTEESTCDIKQGSHLADLLKRHRKYYGMKLQWQTRYVVRRYT